MCAAADMLLNSPHAGEGELYIYTDGDENSSSTDPVSLVCDVCDGYSYGGWNSECDPSDNNPPCTDMQICISQQLINNNVNYVRYFGDPIRFSSIRGDGRDSDGAPALPSDKDPDPETIRAHAFSDVTFLQFLSNQSGGELVYVSDSPSAVELSSFDAFTRGGYVEISWCTLAEINSVGFNVQRSTSEDGLFRTINGEVIPAAGSATEGASYLFTDEDVSAGSDYYYRLEELVTHGEKIVYGPVLAVGGAEPPIPVTFGLAQNYPNPFNPATEISYTLPVDCHVKLEIYNVLGQRIASLVDEPQSAGDKILRWDGRDDKGLRVSSGIYFCRLEAGTFTEIKKMVLTR
jgi:hypothetical protein